MLVVVVQLVIMIKGPVFDKVVSLSKHCIERLIEFKATKNGLTKQ